MIVHEWSEPRRPERVVILGSNGFLGRALASRLAEHETEFLGLSSQDVDLTAADAGEALARRLRSTDSLVMFAATKPGRRLDNNGYVANVAMGSAVCEAIRKAGCAHVVYMSSDAVYPFTAEPVREDVSSFSTSLYSLMHLAREVMLGMIEGPPLARLRVSQVYGLGDPHNAYGPGRMVRSALTEGRIVLYGSGEETRDHIHVGDVISVLLEVLTMRSRGLANVATGRSVSFAGLAEVVRQVCGGDVAIVREPRRMPILHRSFDTTVLNTAFPMRVQTPLQSGISILVDEYRRAAGLSFGNPRPEHATSAAARRGPSAATGG
jgi:UDP-glucose 4-epimerase